MPFALRFQPLNLARSRLPSRARSTSYLPRELIRRSTLSLSAFGLPLRQTPLYRRAQCCFQFGSPHHRGQERALAKPAPKMTAAAIRGGQALAATDSAGAIGAKAAPVKRNPGGCLH
jgi:hypothetical protein